MHSSPVQVTRYNKSFLSIPKHFLSLITQIFNYLLKLLKSFPEKLCHALTLLWYIEHIVNIHCCFLCTCTDIDSLILPMHCMATAFGEFPSKGHSKTTLTWFGHFLSQPWLTFLKEIYNFYEEKSICRWHFSYHVPSLSSQRSFWMPFYVHCSSRGL